MIFWQARCEYGLAGEWEMLSVEVIFATFGSGLQKDWLNKKPNYCFPAKNAENERGPC